MDDRQKYNQNNNLDCGWKETKKKTQKKTAKQYQGSTKDSYSKKK